LWAAAGLVLLIGIPRAAPGQARRWERQVRDQLAQAVESLRAKGFARAHVTRISVLDSEESESVSVPLEAGQRYAVVGVCDDDCSGLHVVVSNAAGSEIATDRASGGVPFLRIAARETGSYRVKMVMAACRMNPCWYAVAVVGAR
jgi:hypothetical protein